jgi:peptidyl-tRNA hydrolase, PTH1 family
MKYLITGLGNPGEKYQLTRHNIGFIVLDHIAAKKDLIFNSDRYGWTTEFKLKNKQLTLLKPSTYMNLSGKAVRYWMNQLKIPVENILVITDDISLPTGKLRMKAAGGPGGHNGLISIIEHLGTENFPRLRFGIGNDFPKGLQAQYVLENFTSDELKQIQPKIELSVDFINSFVLEGINISMNRFNKN